jgi:serine/threonine-protein kinase
VATPQARLPDKGALVGDHVLERALGRGGMGAVFVARHVSLGTRRAVKVMLPGKASALERFQREARALARIDRHPGVVAIHSAGVQDGLAYLVLDLIDGGDLEGALAAGPFALDRALRVGASVAEALAHIHAAGIVHRDLKPANVLLRAQDDSPVLTDFGIVRDEAEARMTASHTLVGSPHFMAPEQITADRATIGPASDVWALGVVLYLMLTGEQPFEGESLPALTAAITQTDPRAPSRVRADLPRALDQVVLAALEKEPARRPGAATLAQALRAIAAGEDPGLARASSVSRMWRRTPERLRRSVIVAAASAVALVLGLGLVQTLWVGPRAAALRAVGEARDFDAGALAPWRLGLRGDPPPATADDLARRVAALRAAAERLPAEQASAAEGLAVRLEAHARLLAPGVTRADVPRATTGRAPLDLVIDALLLERAGDARAALARVDAALALEPGLVDARLLALRLRATLAPRDFLAAARGLPAAERTFAASLAPAAVRAQYTELIRGAPLARSRDDVRRELEAVAAAARELGVATDDLAEDKAELVDADGAAWEALLEDASRRGVEEDALLRAAAVLGAEPRARPGPRLRAALEAFLGRLYDARAAAEARGDRAGAARLLDQLVRAESIVFYELDDAWRPRPALRVALENHLLIGQTWSGDGLIEGILMGLRTGLATASGKGLLKRTTTQALAHRLQLHPRSRALRFAMFICALRDAPDWPTSAPAIERLLPLLRAALEDGLTDDLAPIFVGEAWLYLASLEFYRVQPAGPGAEQARAYEAVVAATRTARRGISLPDDHQDAFRLEAAALGALGRPEEALAVWDQAIAHFRPRAEQGAEGSLLENELHGLALAHHGRAQLLEALSRDDEALAAAREALAVQCTTSTGDAYPMAVLVSRLLRERGDPAGAVEALRPHERLGMPESATFVVEAVRAHLAAGDEGRARGLLDEGLRLHPQSGALSALRKELAR